MNRICATVILGAVVASPLLTPIASATDRLVPRNYRTIQEAVTAANNGDKVLISPGVYYEAVTAFSKSIQIIGIGGPEVTIVDGEGWELSTFQLISATLGAKIEGLTFRHGETDSNGNGGNGLLVSSGTAEIKNCIFTGNVRAGLRLNTANATITDCVIIDNASPSVAGGVRIGDGTYAFTRCTIADNVAANSGGGAWQSLNASVVWTDCTFTGNYSGFKGGGLYVDYFETFPITGSPVTLTGCTFSGNHATSNTGLASGGGVFSGQKAIITDCVFSQNSAVGIAPNLSQGAGLRLEKADDSTLANCDFLGHDATSLYATNSDLQIDGSDFMNNHGVHYPGALLFLAGEATITNCVFTQNSGEGEWGAAVGDGGLNTYDTCTFTGNTGTFGGAITVFGTTKLANCTITDNVAAGGGLFNVTDNVLIADSTICDNTFVNIDGDWTDLGGNDICPNVFGDLNGDGIVDGADLGILLAQWDSEGPQGDLDNDLDVDGADLGLLLAAWTFE
jgi:predicted outer membrane repeat protein